MKFIEPKIISRPDSIGNEDCSFAYYSKNPVMRWVFLQRLKQAAAFLPDKLEPKQNILDIGTGCGFMLPTLSKLSRNGNIVAFDYNEEHLKKSMILGKDNHLSVSFVKGNVYNLPFSDNFFSIVTAISVLEHIKSLDKAVAEIRRVIKDGGVLVVGVPVERFLVNALFSLLSLKDSILDGKSNSKGKFHRNKYQDFHCSDIKDVEDALSKYFIISKSKKIFSDYTPDAFSLYKVYQCIPKQL